jgi:hypothetical protein
MRAAAQVAASPLDSETLAMLEAGARGDPATIRQLLGRPPRPIDQGRYQSGQ